MNRSCSREPPSKKKEQIGREYLETEIKKHIQNFHVSISGAVLAWFQTLNLARYQLLNLEVWNVYDIGQKFFWGRRGHSGQQIRSEICGDPSVVGSSPATGALA
ncbi:hypothetical protein PoB_004616100 [Plakobranchus ocellatus]|uniref:Uncharacterized protein n=1 Tax=Plakobranchus ocellatus TaxID=259542 RepID=A0AAV4BGU1_9GAST|nr:hypothetical protein PoB_004616100 [Plakobranchus ocellatus]